MSYTIRVPTVLPSLKFPDFSSQSHNIPRPILPHISVPKTCNNLQHQRVLLRHADFTISYDSVPRSLTFFSYTHFTCCLKFGKISSIHSVTDTFSIYSSLLIPDFGAFLQATSRVPRWWIGERPPDMAASCDIYK